MNNISITIIVILTTFLQVQAQSTPNEFVKEFFKDYSTQGNEVAINKLYSTNPWILSSDENTSNMISRMPQPDSKILGDYISYELITSKKITEDYQLLSYFVKYDRQMVRFTFTFYRPQDKWRIHAIKFDDSFTNELEEMMKLYYKSFE